MTQAPTLNNRLIIILVERLNIIICEFNTCHWSNGHKGFLGMHLWLKLEIIYLPENECEIFCYSRLLSWPWMKIFLNLPPADDIGSAQSMSKDGFGTWRLFSIISRSSSLIQVTTGIAFRLLDVTSPFTSHSWFARVITNCQIKTGYWGIIVNEMGTMHCALWWFFYENLFPDGRKNGGN